MGKIVIALFAAGSNNIVELAEDGSYVFVDYCGTSGFLPGDKVPPHWEVKPVNIVVDDGDESRRSVYESRRSVYESRRSGYETGLANKPDPNPFREGSTYHDEWRTGYRLGEWQRKQYDKEQVHFMAQVSANIK